MMKIRRGATLACALACALAYAATPAMAGKYACAGICTLTTSTTQCGEGNILSKSTACTPSGGYEGCTATKCDAVCKSVTKSIDSVVETDGKMFLCFDTSNVMQKTEAEATAQSVAMNCEKGAHQSGSEWMPGPTHGSCVATSSASTGASATMALATATAFAAMLA